MIRLVFTVACLVAFAHDRMDNALVWAVLAVGWAPGRPNLLRSWLGWDDAIARAQAEDVTLFDGRRDD